MTVELQWEEPAGFSKKRRRDWAAVAEALRSRPGAWAVIDTDCAAASATGYRNGKNVAFPVGEFEFRAEGTQSGRASKLFARYVGAVAS